MKWITALQLDTWADTIPARTTFPGMIADLIRASVDQISAIRFPSGDMGQVRGFDGVLESSEGSTYIREGRSIWEFGVADKPVQKANGDLDKRKAQISEVDRANITFVFVSPRTWDNPQQKRDEWITAKSNDGWKEVMYLDGAMIEDWLAAHPAVAARYARNELKLAPQTGAISTDEFWDEYSKRFAPPLIEEVLLCEREAQVQKLLQAVRSASGTVHFSADSPDEVLAFAVAAIRKAPEAIRHFLEARTIIVETVEAVRHLTVKSGLIFLPRGQARNSVGLLAGSGPVVVSAGADEAKSVHEPLPRPSSFELGKALALMMGCDHVEGIEVARKCGRSLAVLARQKPSGTAETPEWVDRATLLLPALFAGGWSAANEADKAVLRVISGASDYDQVETPLRPLTRLKDAPLDRVEDVWKVRAPIDAFTYLAPMIGDADLQKLRQAITDVFSRVESVAPETEALFQSSLQRVTLHSKWLRDGLMTTLLIIAALHDAIELQITGTTPQRFVDDVVRNIQGLISDERFIHSFENELPLLAEAAPDPFVEALERLLEGDALGARSIFNEGAEYFAPTSPHVNVLWALEVLAWDDKYLQRVALILARLAEIDPGGKLSNRPINSLRAIFLSWSPNTNASVKERIRVLRYVVRVVPNMAWALLIKLLPNYHDTSMPTARPKFRDTGILAPEPITYNVVWESQSAVVSMALERIGSNTERMITIIKSMGQFEENSLNLTLQAIEKFLISSEGEGKQLVWDALRKEVNRNKKFENAEWAIKGHVLTILNDIVVRHAPADTRLANTWLFDEWLPDLPGNPDGSREAVLAARNQVLISLFLAEGVEGIFSLIQAVKHPFLVLEPLANIKLTLDDVISLVAMIIDRKIEYERIAGSVLAIGVERFGQSCIDALRTLESSRKLGHETIARLLMALPETHETWLLIESFGEKVNEFYWCEKQPIHLSGSLEDLFFAVEKYLSLGRSLAAIAAIHDRRIEVPSQLLFKLLDAAIPEINSSQSGSAALTDYYIEEIFKSLESRTDISLDDLARREFAYLPILEMSERPLILHRLMAQNPSLFMSVICAVFNPASVKDAQTVSVEEERFASAAYGLLTKLYVIPGQKGEEVDEVALLEWCLEVRRLAIEADRVRVTDQYIGQLLAHSPLSNNDKTWPHGSVRSVIERLESDDIETGIQIERFNMRGVYTKAIGEGGKQERAFADQAAAWAKAASETPRTSAMLRRIAESWLIHAEHEDVRAEKNRLRH